MWSIPIGGCGPYQLVGVVRNWWVWSIPIRGHGLFHLVGVVCINRWVWIFSVVHGQSGLAWCEVVPLRFWFTSFITVACMVHHLSLLLVWYIIYHCCLILIIFSSCNKCTADGVFVLEKNMIA